MVEPQTFNLLVAGSSPAGTTNFRDEPKDKEGVGSVPIIVRESSHHRTILVWQNIKYVHSYVCSFAILAQLVEQGICNAQVVSSILTDGSTFVLLYIYSESSYDGW